jgi:CheY-like chemotaxis protein
MGRIEATHLIHALLGWENLPILAMTANASDDDRRVGLEARMKDRIGKPVEPDLLYAACSCGCVEAPGLACRATKGHPFFRRHFCRKMHPYR